MTQTIGVDGVPGPKGLPYLGNLLDIDRDSPIEGFMRMAREYGPIFRLSTPAGVRLMISDPVMVDEVCDDERYDKKIAAGLKSIQSSVAGGGLFSSTPRTRCGIAPIRSSCRRSAGRPCGTTCRRCWTWPTS